MTAQVSLAPAPPAAWESEPLSESLRLFAELSTAGVRYCHFKSNEHLVPGLAGHTDLDVLVDPRDAAAARATLAGTGFKRFQGHGGADYPCVEDYLGFGARTGRVLHVQLHFALIVGEKHQKSYQLGFGHDLLEGRVRDPATGVYTADPSHELVLLLLRYALKVRSRDLIAAALGRDYFGGDALVEFRWLVERADPEPARRFADATLGAAAGELLAELHPEPPDVWQLLRLRRRAAPRLARWRTTGALETRLRRGVGEFRWLLAGINRHVLGWPRPFHRTNPTGGRVIALLGPDGSGKSTLVRELRRTFSPKLDVYSVYFGSGDGSSSILRWPLRATLRAWRRLRPRAPGTSRGGTLAARPRRPSPLRAVWAIALALEKRAKLRATTRARNRGMLVICDRYPQTSVAGFNDGPLLAGWSESRFGPLRRLAGWEGGIYASASDTPPDLAIKLVPWPEVAVARKPEMSIAEVKRRIEAVRRIRFGPRCEHVEIDANRDLPEVSIDVARCVWDHM